MTGTPVQLLEYTTLLKDSYQEAALYALGAIAILVVEKEGDTNLVAQMQSLRDAAFHLQQQMNADPLRASDRLAAFQLALFNDIRATFQGLRDQDDRERMRAEDLPAPLRHRFISKGGSLYLLQVYPKSNVWERAHQAEFVKQLRTIDPEVTGTPVQFEAKGTGAWHLLDSKGPDPEVAKLGRKIQDDLVAPCHSRISETIGVSDREAATLARMIVAAGRAVLGQWYGGELTREEAVRDTTRGVTALLKVFSRKRR